MSRINQRFLAWSAGVGGGPSSEGHIEEGHQEASHGEWLLPKIRTSVLSVLSWRQFFIQAATLLGEICFGGAG